MSGKNWVKVSEFMDAAFSIPCKGHYLYIRHPGINIGCDKPDERHGHIELNDEDGMYAFITFPCYSQAGVKAAVELLKPTLSDEECRGIFDMEDVKKLPVELAEVERLFIASTEEIESIFKGWWGW